MIDGMILGSMDIGLVAQSGRAPGFYSPDLRLFAKGMKRHPMVEGSNPSEPVCPGR